MTAPAGRTSAEFVALVALTTSLVAMSIDTMLPALGQIAEDLALADPNVSTVFILVPIAAPAFGQLVLLLASWRAIFWLLVLAALVDASWFALRQPETLPPERRVPFSPARVLAAFGEVFRHPITIGYTFAIGALFSAFIAYLATSQQVFQDQYGVGRWFPVLFGGLAFSIGLASLTNAQLVMRFGMRRLARLAVLGECAISTTTLLVAFAFEGHPPLPVFMVGMVGCFFCSGILFGNYNARALEPMGHIAGVAAAIVGSLSGLVALALGTPLGRAYDGTVISVIGSYVLASFLALTLTETAERRARLRGAALGQAH